MAVPVTLQDLGIRLGTVRRTLNEPESVELVAEINGRELPLTLDNFFISNEGRLQINVPVEWFTGRPTPEVSP
ncbi:hypothetical protein D3C76_654890 [compost metagenome]